LRNIAAVANSVKAPNIIDNSNNPKDQLKTVKLELDVFNDNAKANTLPLVLYSDLIAATNFFKNLSNPAVDEPNKSTKPTNDYYPAKKSIRLFI